MNRNRRALRIVGAALLIGTVAGAFGGNICGWVEAQIDLARGTPRYKRYGSLEPADDEFTKRLLKHHVKVERVAGCVVPPFFGDAWDTYNATIIDTLGIQ